MLDRTLKGPLIRGFNSSSIEFSQAKNPYSFTKDGGNFLIENAALPLLSQKNRQSMVLKRGLDSLMLKPDKKKLLSQSVCYDSMKNIQLMKNSPRESPERTINQASSRVKFISQPKPTPKHI